MTDESDLHVVEVATEGLMRGAVCSIIGRQPLPCSQGGCVPSGECVGAVPLKQTKSLRIAEFSRTDCGGALAGVLAC